MNILDKFSLIGDIITGNNDKNKDKNVNISDLKEDLSKLTNNVYTIHRQTRTF